MTNHAQMNAVDSLLTRLGLSKYITVFRERNIVNPKVLKGLTEDQYKGLIEDEHDRGVFLKAVAGEENVPVSAPQGRSYEGGDDDDHRHYQQDYFEHSRPRGGYKGGYKGGKGKGGYKGDRDGHDDFDDFDRYGGGGYKGGKKGGKKGYKGYQNRERDFEGPEHPVESELVDNGIVERTVTVPTYTFKFLLANKAKKLCEIHRRNGTHNAQIKKEDTDLAETQFSIFGPEEAVLKTKEEIEKLCGIERKHLVDARFQEALLGRTKMVTSLLYALNLRRIENGEETALQAETIPEHVSRFLFCNPYSHIKQFYIKVQEKPRSKVEVMGKILANLPACQAITFVSQSDHIVKILKEKVKKEQLSGLEPSYLYPALTKEERQVVLEKFRTGAGPLDKTKYVEDKKNEEKKSDVKYIAESVVTGGFASKNNRLLIASDDYARFARKNDIPYVGLTIHYDTPPTKEGYLHRIACCGRGGHNGVSILLIGNETKFMDDLKHFGVEIEELPENFYEAIQVSETTDLLGPTEKVPESEQPRRKKKAAEEAKAEGEEAAAPTAPAAEAAAAN